MGYVILVTCTDGSKTWLQFDNHQEAASRTFELNQSKEVNLAIMFELGKVQFSI